jgi:hypothetical protein
MKNLTLLSLLRKVETLEKEASESNDVFCVTTITEQFSRNIQGGKLVSNGNCIGGTNYSCLNSSCTGGTNLSCTNGTCP